MSAAREGRSGRDRNPMIQGRQARTTERLVVCALLAGSLLTCHEPRPVELVLRNATIVDVEGGEAVTGRAVLVSDGLVHGVVDEARLSTYRSEMTIDCGGGYLIPALADAHVHLGSAAELRSYLRYGVGLVVNMSGGPMHLRWREEVAAGRLEGPQIVTVGPTLDGSPPTNPLFTTVEPESADEIVAWIAERGYDAVKVYQQMDAPTLAAVVEAASSRGMIVTGHVSRPIGIAGALDAGLRYVAHGEELAFEAFDEQSRTFDRGGVAELAALIADRGVTVTPMIDYLASVPRQVLALEEYLGSDPMSLVPASTRLSFGSRQGWFSNRDEPEAFARQMEDVTGFVSALTAQLNARGVPLILGTDSGFGGAIPGLSAHLELQRLVEAGLSELDALRTATRDVGLYLQRIDPRRTPWGRIEPGFSADLLLLAEDPLEEISATLAIEGVLRAGRWLDAEELARLEAELRARQSALIDHARAFESALVAGDPDAARAAAESRPAELKDEPLISADNCIFLGYSHYYGGRRELAGRLYEICAEMHPESSPLWVHIARAREAGGDKAAAIDAFRSAVDLNPWYGAPGAAIRSLEEAPE